jgi:hypothetical protein
MIRENIKKYIDEIQEIELKDNQKYRDYKIEDAKEIFDEDEIKVLLVYSTIINYMNTNANSEIMDISIDVINELNRASSYDSLSSNFINSFYNFNNIYTPLYDLLDLATNGKFDGKPMTDEYRNGIIDSIIVLRKYQRNAGFGDHQWDISYNSAIEKPI